MITGRYIHKNSAGLFFAISEQALAKQATRVAIMRALIAVKGE